MLWWCAHQIIGIDRTDAFDFVAIEKMLFGHFDKLRRHPVYRRCFNMVYFESQSLLAHTRARGGQ